MSNFFLVLSDTLTCSSALFPSLFVDIVNAVNYVNTGNSVNLVHGVNAVHSWVGGTIKYITLAECGTTKAD